jgi:hypothetical protein
MRSKTSDCDAAENGLRWENDNRTLRCRAFEDEVVPAAQCAAQGLLETTFVEVFGR